MFGGLLNFFRDDMTASADPGIEALEAAAPQSDTLPADLIAAIGNALVTWRHFQGNEDKDEASYSSAVVRIVGLGGMWRFDGIVEAAARVAKHYPDLTPQACRRAAKMIYAEIGKRNLYAHRRQSRRRWDVMGAADRPW